MHRENALRGDHPVDVVRRRLEADEDHRPGRTALHRSVGIEDDPAARGTRACVQAPRDRFRRVAEVDHRVQQLVELRRVDARDRLLARDQPLVDHVDRGLQ